MEQLNKYVYRLVTAKLVSFWDEIIGAESARHGWLMGVQRTVQRLVTQIHPHTFTLYTKYEVGSIAARRL